jgi:putative solute:sodium symporter small subunit
MSDSHGLNAQAYWKENIRTVLLLLSVWFVVSYGMGILFADELDGFRFFGFRLGFWMAQQGSIFCFVILIFVYVYRMNKLDHKYGVDEDRDDFVPDEDYYHLQGTDDSSPDDSRTGRP